MKLKLVMLAMASLVTFNTHATAIDYQHEFKDSSGGEHNDSLRFSTLFDQGLNLSVEARWAQHPNDKSEKKPFNERVDSGTEVIAGYQFDVNKTFSVEPGFSLESTADYNSYRPYLRGKVNVANGLSASLTYRPYYKRNSKNIGTPEKTSEKGYNLTSVIAYDFMNDYTLEYEFDYQNSNEEKNDSSEKNRHMISHDFKLNYQWDKNWRPYMAIGNVPDSGNGNHRQTRYRIGIQYSF